MKINHLPDDGSRCIAFTQASARQVEQALTDAAGRLRHHFPGLSSATWSDALRQLQPDLLVSGKVVTFDWLSLTRRVQGLSAFPELSAIGTPPNGPVAAELMKQLKSHQQQAVQVLAELQESTRVVGALVQKLFAALAPGGAVAGSDHDATRNAGSQPVTNPRPQTLVPPLPPSGPASAGIDSPNGGRKEAGAISSLLKKKVPNRTPRRNALKRRTFRDIVRYHPRANGQFGFTVRELCATMHISAASLTEARDNPGRLSLNAVVALAEAMGESPMQVFVDLLAEAGAKPRKKRKNQQTRLTGGLLPQGRMRTPSTL